MWRMVSIVIWLVSPYLFPVTGTYVATRLEGRPWWPSLPEILLVVLPMILYAGLTAMKDRQGFAIGMPAFMIAVPVMFTFWAADLSDKGLAIPFRENVGFYVAMRVSLATTLIVYLFYPRAGLHW